MEIENSSQKVVQLSMFPMKTGTLSLESFTLLGSTSVALGGSEVVLEGDSGL